MGLRQSSHALRTNEDGFLWATPTALGLMLLIGTIGRIAFWLPPIEGAPINVSSHIASLFALPFGIAAVMILAAKRHTPGPDWQHSHWKHHLRTLTFGAVGGCVVALILFPAVTQQHLSPLRMMAGGATLLLVSGTIIWRTITAIQASRRQQPIN